MALTAQPLAVPNEHTQDALQALSDTHEANLADTESSDVVRSRAVIVVGDGTQVRCDVNDLNIDGAYLIRRQGRTGSPKLRSGDVVKVFIFHPGNPLLESVTLSAHIVRTESNDGPGLAIRFKHTQETLPHGTKQTQETLPHGNQVEWETEVPEPVVPKAYSASAMSAPEPSSLAGATLVMSTVRLGKPLFWATVVGLNLAAFVLLSQWLNAVL